MSIPAEEEEVWSSANHDRDGKTVLRTRDAQETERNCHLIYISMIFNTLVGFDLVGLFSSPDQNEEARDEEENSGRTKNHVLLEDLPSQEPTLSEEGIILIRQNMEEEAITKGESKT